MNLTFEMILFFVCSLINIILLCVYWLEFRLRNVIIFENISIGCFFPACFVDQNTPRE